jgi:hypothetical protein
VTKVRVVWKRPCADDAWTARRVPRSHVYPVVLRRYMHIFQKTGPNAVSNVGLEIAAVDDGPLCGLQGTLTVSLPNGSYVAPPQFVNNDMIVNIALC